MQSAGTSAAPDAARQVLSLLASVVILLVGLIWSYRVGQEANALAHRLGHEVVEVRR